MTTDEQIFLLRRAKDLLQQAQAQDLAGNRTKAATLICCAEELSQIAGKADEFWEMVAEFYETQRHTVH